ncbi:hypothetical protein [Paenibacillus popilliae]|uniref:DUF1049 domain-containing protein n=1 Tax=Paenibacillus popilliae TaxID=78057 RepID=A0ABY3ARC5_PAEPP|nr:hypothetical protein [Paenibacillus sp. SDF0028]TQR45268.1 hypothetical protein C7Y44_13470 [Paenibacillus sp. SDF0028]
MASILRLIGICILVGSLIMGVRAEESLKLFSNLFDLHPAWAWWISGVIGSVLFFSIAMVLDRLERIERMLTAPSTTTAPTQSNIVKTNPNLKIKP